MGAAANPSEAARRTGLILFVTCWACVLVMAITAAGATVLPAIAEDLGASQSELQWIGDSYPLILAALLMPAGAVLDRYGRKRGLVMGLGVLAVALAASSFSHSTTALVAFRCLAGVGAALVFPATLATIGTVVPPHRRGSAVGLWAATATLGGLIGILLGGALIEVAWWGSIFLVLAVLSVGCLVASILVVPETSDPEHANLDPIGAVTSIVAVGAVVFAVTEGPVHGWTDPLVVGMGALGILAAVVFARWELRVDRPLIDLRLFRDRSLATSSAALFLLFFAIFGWFFLSFQYQTLVLGYGPFRTALGLSPFMLPLIPVAPFAPALARRYGRRLVIASGLTIAAAGMTLMAVLGGSADYGSIAVAFAVLGLGCGLAATPPTEAILEALPPAKQGVASAINDTARELGAAVGIAVIGSAFNAGYRGHVGDGLTAVPEPIAEAVRSSPAAGFGALAEAGAQAPVELAGVIRDGIIAGWEVAFVLAAAVIALGAVYVARYFPAHHVAAARASDPAGGLEGAA